MTLDFYRKIRHVPAGILAKFFERQAEMTLRKNRPLWGLLQDYLKNSPSTGCAYSDYLLLYNYIRNRKPKEVLECGTGVSTVVIAYALKENERDYGIKGRVTSMEESPNYYNVALKLFPERESLKSYAEIVLSPVMEDTYHFFRGIRYKDVPLRPYDFVFVDGPDYLCDPKGEIILFNFDFVDIVRKSEKPVGALIDTRTTTCFVYSLLFGDEFRYDYVRKVGIVEPVTKNDLAPVQKIVARSMRAHSFKRPPFLNFIRGTY